MNNKFAFVLFLIFCLAIMFSATLSQAALGDRVETVGDRNKIDVNLGKTISDINSQIQQAKNDYNSEEFWNNVEDSNYSNKPVPILIALEKGCVPQKQTTIYLIASKVIYTSDSLTYRLVALPLGQVDDLLNDPCIQKVSQSEDRNEFLAFVKQSVQEEIQQKIKDMNLKLTRGLDVNSLKELAASIKPATPEQGGDPNAPAGQISSYQSYVTPSESSVISVASGKNSEQVYLAASSWPWVSEETLNYTSELWFTPKVFLTQTPTMETNPIKGTPADDCEEHANTLVSALRASGVSANNVRVVLGKVNFGGEIGGHAWAEIYTNGSWMVLDSTSGPYWDDTTNKEVIREPLPYNYWATRPFPVVQYWAYYNDTYYKEVGGPNNSPQAWNSTANAYDSGIEESFSTASLSTAEEEIASIISDVVADNNTQDTTPVNDNGNNSVANNSNNTDLTSNNNSADNTNTQDDSVTNNADNGAKTNQGLPTGLIVGAVILVIVVLCAVVIFKGKK